jgi:quinolinate synthase
VFPETPTHPQVKELHPAHTAASIKALLPRLRIYNSGTCIVHHLFGGEVTELVKEAYGDAYLTAHFEVSNATSPYALLGGRC